MQDGADAVLSTSADGWTAGTPLTALTDDRDAMLAVAMNGEPLTARARLSRPDGRARPVRLRLGHQVGRRPRGHPLRPIQCVLDRPRLVGERSDQDRVADRRAGQRAPVVRRESSSAGVAWAQHTGIDKVELQIGDDDWVTCELADEPTIDSWRQWSYRVERRARQLPRSRSGPRTRRATPRPRSGRRRPGRSHRLAHDLGRGHLTSASSSADSRSRPRAVWLFTVPSEMPSSIAVSRVDRPSQ